MARQTSPFLALPDQLHLYILQFAPESVPTLAEVCRELYTPLAAELPITYTSPQQKTPATNEKPQSLSKEQVPLTREKDVTWGDCAWKGYVQARWGPLNEISEFSIGDIADSAAVVDHKKSISQRENSFLNWRDLAYHLEVRVFPVIERYQTLSMLPHLVLDDSAALTKSQKDYQNIATTMHCLLRRVNIETKRRITRLICRMGFYHPDFLRTFLWQADFQGVKNPEQALRKLLFQFPFLPIDAGEGAHQVLSVLADIYAERKISNDTCFEARGTVYIIIYSLIMLNTDLHNPIVQPKITCEQYIASCYRTSLAQCLPRDMLSEMYESIKSNPLKIQNGEDGRSSSLSPDAHRRAPFYTSVPSYRIMRRSGILRREQNELQAILRAIGNATDHLKALKLSLFSPQILLMFVVFVLAVQAGTQTFAAQ